MFEIRQRISEPPLQSCDRCGGPVRRLLSPAPFILKGGGWYVTDYPSEARKKAVESEASSGKAGSAEGKSSTGADSPPSSSNGSPSSSAGKVESSGKAETGSKDTPKTKGKSKGSAKT